MSCVTWKTTQGSHWMMPSPRSSCTSAEGSSPAGREREGKRRVKGKERCVSETSEGCIPAARGHIRFALLLSSRCTLTPLVSVIVSKLSVSRRNVASISNASARTGAKREGDVVFASSLLFSSFFSSSFSFFFSTTTTSSFFSFFSSSFFFSLMSSVAVLASSSSFAFLAAAAARARSATPARAASALRALVCCASR